MSFKNEWCRHYSGMMNKSCDAGVEYDSIKDTSVVPYRFHCIHADTAVPCALRAEYTPEEIEERHRQIAAALTRFASFLGGESDECPHCGTTIESAEKIGRCVYARPCGCRVMQGEVPDRWKK